MAVKTFVSCELPDNAHVPLAVAALNICMSHRRQQGMPTVPVAPKLLLNGTLAGSPESGYLLLNKRLDKEGAAHVVQALHDVAEHSVPSFQNEMHKEYLKQIFGYADTQVHPVLRKFQRLSGLQKSAVILLLYLSMTALPATIVSYFWGV